MTGDINKYSYMYVDVYSGVKDIDYNVEIRDYYDKKLDKIIRIEYLNFPGYIKNGKWMKCTEENSFINCRGIYKNRFTEITEYSVKPDLSKCESYYMTDRIHEISSKLDKLNIEFNLVQVEELNKDYIAELYTYILFKNKKDMAKYKLLA